MVCMAANTKYPKEAWAFLKWFIGKDGLLAASRDTFGTAQLMPSLKSASRSLGYLEPNRKKLPTSFRMEEIVDGIRGKQRALGQAKTGL